MEVMLNQLWMEIIKRRKCMEKYEVDHVNEYNKVTTEEKLPYILICIDEVAMLEDENDSMKIIRKISAVGRSLGVFLMLSMQLGCNRYRWEIKSEYDSQNGVPV